MKPFRMGLRLTPCTHSVVRVVVGFKGLGFGLGTNVPAESYMYVFHCPRWHISPTGSLGWSLSARVRTRLLLLLLRLLGGCPVAWGRVTAVTPHRPLRRFNGVHDLGLANNYGFLSESLL